MASSTGPCASRAARRVALTVPNFMMALAAVTETDLLTVQPRRFAALHARPFGVVNREAPLKLERSLLNAVAPEAALMDKGLVWLLGLLERAEQAAKKRPGRARRRV